MKVETLSEDLVARGFGSTHAGCRANNEDSFLVDDLSGLYVVADGMGGYEGGEIASGIVVERLNHFFRRVEDATEPGFDSQTAPGRSVAESRMRLALRQASAEIERQRIGDLSRMGTTVAAIWISEDRALIAHVGDSRVYRIRNGRIEQLTRDHSLVEQMKQAGAMSGRSNYRATHGHTITRALGVPGCSQPDFMTLEVQKGDRFILCTDGISDVLDNQQLETISREHTVTTTAVALVEQAYISGSTDNITAVAVEI